MEDQEIVKLLRSGKHNQALKALYSSYPSIERLIISNGGTTSQSKDIFQDALVVFFEKVQNRNFELTSKISTYLYGVSRLLWKTELRKQNKGIILDDSTMIHIEDTTLTDVHEHIEKEQKFEFLDEVLKQLGDKCKQILELFYYQKLSMKDIAIQLKYSDARSAKNQKFKCLERAKKMANTQFITQNL